MPSRNKIKLYAQDGYYHLYNRGVGKQPIFLGEQDYFVFMSYLKEYLSPQVILTKEEGRLIKRRYLCKNYYGQIELLAFCLMPNHFHFLVKQTEPRVIENFMRSLFVRYSGYFNKNHSRVGHLFQDIYKGVLIQNEEYLWWLSRYIHRNPLEILDGKILEFYPYSSYRFYLGGSSPVWIQPERILKGVKDYQIFVENESKTAVPEFIEDLYLE